MASRCLSESLLGREQRRHNRDFRRVTLFHDRNCSGQPPPFQNSEVRDNFDSNFALASGVSTLKYSKFVRAEGRSVSVDPDAPDGSVYDG